MVDEAWSSDVTSHLSQNVVMVGKVWWNDFAGYLFGDEMLGDGLDRKDSSSQPIFENAQLVLCGLCSHALQAC